jgi:hypothetical protein
MRTTQVLARGLGFGLVAGFIGTIAMTASQHIEARLTGRKPSLAPAKAVEKVFSMVPRDRQSEQRLASLTHWSYGTVWGAFRGGLDLVGLRGLPATCLHVVAIAGLEMTTLPALQVAPPVKEWGASHLATDLLHECIYALVTGWAYQHLTASKLAYQRGSDAANALQRRNEGRPLQAVGFRR